MIQEHIDAVASGETIEQRLQLIAGSNFLSDEEKRKERYFLKAFCLMAALEPLCGTRVDLGHGLELDLNKPRRELEGNELPGARTDSEGWLVVEGEFWRDGKPCARVSENGDPLWPLMVRNPPVTGSGPWENFRDQALEVLRQAGASWPQQTSIA